MEKEEKDKVCNGETSCSDLRNATNDLIGFFAMMEQKEENSEKPADKEDKKK
ncbi:MAG: hypothetical protein Q3992_06690 [Bacteroides sp.]|nr:hypothetical protein [Bacteroides sp.]